MLIKQHTYKPLSYRWAMDAWATQQGMHWTSSEVALGTDVHDFENLLSPEERYFVKHVFHFFVQGDVEVANCYTHNYLKIFPRVEMQMMLTAFANAETIHIEAYAKLLETLKIPDEDYNAFLNYADMREKYELLHSFALNEVNINNITPRDKMNIAKTIIMFGGFMEGVSLFASFCMLASFQRFGRLKGVGQIIKWSVRDEQLHTNSMVKLYHEFIRENAQDLDLNELEDFMEQTAEKIVELETAFITAAFQDDAKIVIAGLTMQEVIMYVKYITTQKLKDLGYFHAGRSFVHTTTTQPCKWMDEFLYSHEHTNFFEAKSTAYKKEGLSGDMYGEKRIYRKA